jgi:sugar O-acyltransferase (sialic acid O-acetyltransferase NeuD family)
VKQNLIILSAGEFGREVYTWARQAVGAGAAFDIKGFLDDRIAILDSFPYSAPIHGSIETYEPQPNDLFLCAIGDPGEKKGYCGFIAAKGGKFATLIHPTAVIGQHVTIGDGSIICPLTQLSCDISVGKHVTFGTNSNMGHDTIIGDYSQISGSCEINGKAILEEGVFLGSHATILPGVQIGAYAYVGAGSVVLKNVKSRIKVFGNPAVPIGRVNLRC